MCSHHNQVLLPDASICSLGNRGGVAGMMRGVGIRDFNVVTTE